MRRVPAIATVFALALCGQVVRADTFSAGSLIIPVDTTYQDAGMLKAYGLLYNLLFHGVPVRWVINPQKAYQGADFTASATSLKTGATITNHGYRGGPFVIDSADAAAAMPFISAWWTAHPTPLVAVHSATADFDGAVAKVLIAAPKVAMHADGNQTIAISYLNGASIPDSQGNPWPSTSPDLLTPAQVAGPTTTNHHDGALFDGNGIPLYCQFMSMHWDVNSAAKSPETVWEVRSFLNNPVHFFAECQAVDAFENTVQAGQNGLPGHFLTTNGLVFGPRPSAVDYYNPAQTFAQIDGTFGTEGGSEPSYALAPGSAYKVGGIAMLTGHGVPPGQGQDVWMTGFLDGACPPDAESCGTLGKVSYLGGHQYTTGTPISTNPTTQGVRLFLNSLFDSACASQDGFPAIWATTQAPARTTSSALVYTISYWNAGPTAALNVVLTDPLPAGASFVSATNGGTFSGGTVTWKLGNVNAGEGGTLDVTVTLAAFGTYSNTATLGFKVGLNGFTQPSNQTSTLYAQCFANADCSSAKPICDAGTYTCRACQSNTDCVGSAHPVCDLVVGSPNVGTCVACASDSNCSAPDPRCNLATNTCVQCLVPSDCTGTLPTCYLTTYTCHLCTSDADCTSTPSTPACQPPGTPKAGSCGQCSALETSLCTGKTSVCDQPSGTCVGCEKDADCGGTTPVCRTQTHTCQPCQTNNDCTTSPAAQACATTGANTRACVQCTGDAFCSGVTPRCDVMSNGCIGCLANQDCQMGSPVCNPSTQTCVVCVSNADCPVGLPLCTSMTCSPCQADYTQNPSPAVCPTPELPACQPSGSALPGACTQCSDTNATACTGNPGRPVCVVASAACGCNQDGDCGSGSYCEKGQISTGICQTGTASSSSGGTDGGTTSSSSGGTGGGTASSSSGAASSSGGAASSSSSSSGGTTGSSSTGGTMSSSGGSSGSTTSGSSGATSSSGGSSGGNGGAPGNGTSSSGDADASGSGGATTAGGEDGGNRQGSCSCRAAPAPASPLRLVALVGLLVIAGRRRARGTRPTSPRT